MFDDWLLLLTGNIGAFIFVPYAIWSMVVWTAGECRTQYFHRYTLRCIQNAATERIQLIEATLGHPIDEVIVSARCEESHGGHQAVVDVFRSWKMHVPHESNIAQEEVSHAG